jgi:nucleoid-associated protein YgaU
VKSGDSFYKIAKEQLGNAERWKELLALNKTLVNGDPSSLQPGQTLVLPD